MNRWQDFSVDQLVPHAGIMMLLDRVLEYEGDRLVAEVVVRGDALFGDGDTVPSWLGIEYMAQSVAALGGMKRRLAGKPINLGFLLGTRRYECNVAVFPVGTRLTVNAQQMVQDQGLGVFDCHLKARGIVASAKLNVYQPDAAINRVILES